MPDFDLASLPQSHATAEARRPVAALFKKGAILSSQNGLGEREVMCRAGGTY